MKKFLALTLALVMALALVACGNSSSKDTGKAAAGTVYYLNFKPESDAAWQQLAKDYTAETGVTVKVVTAAVWPGETSVVTVPTSATVRATLRSTVKVSEAFEAVWLTPPTWKLTVTLLVMLVPASVAP